MFKNQYTDTMKFDGVILDIDGTIWNTTEIVADAWNKAIECSHYNIKITADILKRIRKDNGKNCG